VIKTNFDTRNLSKILGNTVKYSNGFIDGINISQTNFNKDLGNFIKDALNKYIDAKARSNPESFHHIYEWEMTGQPNGRLFDFSISYTKNLIKFTGKLLPSRTPSPNSGDVFRDKATIMEDSVTITIEPKDANVLVFENDGETIFTSASVTIENPGGAEVGGSFENAIQDFFNNYISAGLLRGSGIFDKLGYPREYLQKFSQGTKYGKNPGIVAGKEYLNIRGIGIE